MKLEADCCSASALLLAASAGAQAAEKFAVVMGNMPSANQFWALVEKGAQDKAKELGIEVIGAGLARRRIRRRPARSPWSRTC